MFQKFKNSSLKNDKIQSVLNLKHFNFVVYLIQCTKNEKKNEL